MAPSVYPWHHERWQQLQGMRQRLPHAILFHGTRGIGKTAFAEAFAASLLCEALRDDGHACGKCLACGWFAQYSHPDYRRLRPEILDGEDVETDEDTDVRKSAKATKAPSRDIRIEQVRALAEFMNVSTHRQGKRVVLLYPAEALNSASANALLKTLEEPLPDTVFLLISNGIDRLLPTILSRCRQFVLPMPSQDEALAWLATQRIPAADAQRLLAEQGGAPLAVVEQAQTDSGPFQAELLAALAQPSVDMALRCAEKLQKAAVTDIVLWKQRWLYDLASFKIVGVIRYYPESRVHIAALAERVTTPSLLSAIEKTEGRRAIADHPLSARLFIEDMLLAYAAIFS